ncbi:MAG: hypothetical protein LBQ23_02380 [Puniceicoccales bacterium]|jgi:hypothetical protein|nr:hypothetical protein [Puniceicoccales bacterium]
MKEEHKQKLNKAAELLIYDRTLSDEEQNMKFWQAYNILDILIQTNDPEVLEHLLDFFTKENEGYGGLCEHMKSQIEMNFTPNQVLQAFYKKLNSFAKNDLCKCAQMCSCFMWPGIFEEFRVMFNEVKVENATELLDETGDFMSEERHGYIEILRKDMESW